VCARSVCRCLPDVVLLEQALQVLPSMQARQFGIICGVSSLAGMCAAERWKYALTCSCALGDATPGYRGIPGASVYGASKSALSTFLEALRIELRGTGVSVVDVCPGFVSTDALDVDALELPSALVIS
jgi:short-subunit dehydrogenase